MMKKFTVAISFLLTFSTVACREADDAQKTQVNTIETTPMRMTSIEKLPEVDEEVAPIIPKNLVLLTESERKRVEVATVAERVDLPFAPAIAMDPIDGQKVSIRKNTPTLEYKNKIYYFTSETNRRAFSANPESFTKGALATYQ